MGNGAHCRLWKALGPGILLTCLGFIVAACGSETASEEDDGWRTTPQTTEDENQEVWAALPALPPPPSNDENSRLRDSQQLSYEEFLIWVVADAEAKWQGAVEAAGLAYAPVGFVTFDGIAKMSCGDDENGTNLIHQTQGPIYCYEDQTIYFPLNWQEKGMERTMAEEYGDFAMAIRAAEEVGNHVQEQLGIMEAVRANEYTYRQANLQAYCFAGVWAYSVYDLIEEGDIEEAMNLLVHRDTGDSTEERVQAFDTGLSGDPKECLDYTPLPA